MVANAERPTRMTLTSEPKSFRNIMNRVPETIGMARIEQQTSEMAKTPEGKFALTYLLAARNLLRPVLREVGAYQPDLLQPIGGHEYNPERSIDEVGTAIALTLARETTDIPKFWMRTEESAVWEHISGNGEPPQQGERFAVIDPLDMTSYILKGDRVQTTGIAIYDRQGNLKTAGIISLVDDGFVFVENRNGKLSIYPTPDEDNQSYSPPLNIATLTRRMYELKSTPLMTEGNVWAMDCASGYAVLSLHKGLIDTIVDPFKGNPWYETVIWGRVAQALGYPMTDINGNPVDLAAAMRHVIEKHESDTYRIPFIISRTPEIQKKVLSLLQKK